MVHNQSTALLPLIFMVAIGFYIMTRLKQECVCSFGTFMKVPMDKLINGPYAMPHDHPYLIQHIRKSLSHLTNRNYNLNQPNIIDQSQCNQPEFIINILGEKKNGFFVESNGYDGESLSNTLLFERKYGWKGLLVEPDPLLYALLMKKQRKAWSINACLSPKPFPNLVSYKQELGLGKIPKKSPKTTKKEKYIEVQCLPLYSILMALNITIIDYFSLDVEGNELDVLMTIPWDKVNIRTLSVEFTHIPQGKNTLLQYMVSVGYILYGISKYADKVPMDYIFHRHDVIPLKKSKN